MVMKKLLLLAVSSSLLMSCADDRSEMETTDVYVIENEQYEQTSDSSSGFTDMSTQTKQNVVSQANEAKTVSDKTLQRQLEIVRQRTPYLFKDVGY
jgi:hypothetical protein